MAFLDPDTWADEYLMEESKRYARQQLIEDEMSRNKTEAVKRFYILSHPNYAEQVAVTTAFGYNNSLSEAEKIVDKLCLNDKHIAALLDDKEMMDQLLFQEELEDKMMEKMFFNERAEENMYAECY